MLDNDVLNSGGIYRLIVVSDDGFETAPVLGTWQAIKLKPAAVMCEFLFARDSGSFAIADRPSENGILYESNVVVELPKITIELRDWLDINAERRWVCFAEDFNDYTHIIGEPGLGAILSVNQTTGDTSSSRNFSGLGFLGFSIYRPIITDMNFVDLTENRQLIDLREYVLADIIVKAGDSIFEPIVLRDSFGNIENLTGSVFKLQVKDVDGNLITSFEMGNGFTLQNGNTELLMQKNGTLPVGEYQYDLERTYPNGIVKTQMAGRFIVENQVTI